MTILGWSLFAFTAVLCAHFAWSAREWRRYAKELRAQRDAIGDELAVWKRDRGQA